MRYTVFLQLAAGLLASLMALSSRSAAAQEAKQITEQVQQYQLDNGLTVILNEDHDRPEIFGALVCRVGEKNSPKDATGLPHYLEHMLFKGTTQLGTRNWSKEKPHVQKVYDLYARLSETQDSTERQRIKQQINTVSRKASQYAISNEFINVLRRMGATSVNANTSWDRTMYFSKVPASQIEKWLRVYSHSFQDAVFRDFQSELEVVIEEMNRSLDSPFRQILTEFSKAFYENHPYGDHRLIGRRQDLKNPPLNKMKQFFEQWYVPNNMALVLSGDLEPEQIKPAVQRHFGDWKRQELPERKTYEQQPIEGRKVVKKKIAPIKMGVLGYPTIASGHEDEVTMEVIGELLNNAAGNGLLDQLSNQNKVVQAQFFNRARKDNGVGAIYFVPRQMMQSIKNAEKLVRQQLDTLKAGDFADWKLTAIKERLKRQRKLRMEDPQAKGVILGEAFGQVRDIERYLNYAEQVDQVTKADVVAVANKYFGDDYLAFHAQRGRTKKPKLEKPGYKPDAGEGFARSAFAKAISQMETPAIDLQPVDFSQDVKQGDLQKHVRFFHTTHQANEIFTLKLNFHAGHRQIKALKYAGQVGELARTADQSATQIARGFDTLGTTYSLSVDENMMTLELVGPQRNLDQALAHLNYLMKNLQFEKTAGRKIVSATRASRMQERRQVSTQGQALYSYAFYGERSRFLDRLTLKQIRNLKPEDLAGAVQKALGYQCNIHYAGPAKAAAVRQAVLGNFSFAQDRKAGELPYDKPLQQYDEPQVFFLRNSNAAQTRVMFFGQGQPFKLAQDPKIRFFNRYFGVGFVGLVIKEIREYRALAYAAVSRYQAPDKPGNPASFFGYVGTQADKTNEAVRVFLDLKNDMPLQPGRVRLVRDHLVNSAVLKRPDARNLPEQVAQWQRRGYKEDPRLQRVAAYKQMQPEALRSFYQDYVQHMPINIALAGDDERFDLETIKQHGSYQRLTKSDIFKGVKKKEGEPQK